MGQKILTFAIFRYRPRWPANAGNLFVGAGEGAGGGVGGYWWWVGGRGGGVGWRGGDGILKLIGKP